MSLGLPPLPPDQVAVLTQLLQAQQEQGSALAQRTSQAQGLATQAQNAYQGAAQAPMPQLTPGDTFLPTLIGGLASVLQGNQGPTDRAQAGIQQKKSDLLKARADNLAQLRDVYSQKADEAQKAGDLETTEKYRTKIETLGKTLDLIKSNADRASREEIASIRAQSAAEVAGVRAQSAIDLQNAKNEGKASNDMSYLGNEVKANSVGVRYLPLTNIGAKDKIATLKWAKENGYIAVDPKNSERLDKLDIARQNLVDMENAANELLPKNENDFQGIAANKWNEMRKADARISDFRGFYEALIENLVAVAGGAGSGVRINQAEIKRLTADAPTATTPLPYALGWIKRAKRLIENTERPVLGKIDPEVHKQALVLARKGDTAGLDQLMAEHPEVNYDLEVEKILESK